MTFAEWIQAQPRGTMKRLEREIRIGYSTLHKLKGGAGIARYAVAQRLSDATGGLVSIDEICNPRRPIRKARARSLKRAG
jgi:hypothetical protein